MDIETVRKATTRTKAIAAQRDANARLNNSPSEMRTTARDLRIRAGAIADPSNRHTMLRSAVDYEKQADQLDKALIGKMKKKSDKLHVLHTSVPRWRMTPPAVA